MSPGTGPSPPRISPGAVSSCQALSVLGDGFKQACDTAIALQAPRRRCALAAAQPSCPCHRPCQLPAEADEKWQLDAVGKSFLPAASALFGGAAPMCSQPSGEDVAASSRWLWWAQDPQSHRMGSLGIWVEMGCEEEEGLLALGEQMNLADALSSTFPEVTSPLFKTLCKSFPFICDKTNRN